jgi:hypothetical protein
VSGDGGDDSDSDVVASFDSREAAEAAAEALARPSKRLLFARWLVQAGRVNEG